jgi:hypothetical protein
MKKEKIVNDAELNELRLKVCEVFGRQVVTAYDCDDLSSFLPSIISPQTLRRFFKIISSVNSPALHTLNILSQYCGYKDFDEFRSIQANQDLISYFGRDDSDENYCSKAEDLCNRVMSSPKFLITTHHQLMEFPMVRKFFLEHYPIRDMLGTVYSQYFLAYLKYNKSDEAKIFAYGFLFKSAFLQENDELVHLYFNKIKDIELSTDIFVVPAGLKFGVQLLYADYIKDDVYFDFLFSEMKKWRKKYIPKSEKSACSFEYSVLELLIFTDRTKEIQFLIDNNTEQIYPDRHFVSEERKQTHREVWKILCAAAYQKIGNKTKCLEYLKSINLNNLGIGWEKYYSILYYLTCVQNIEFSIDVDPYTKFLSLVDETYFSYYRSIIQEILKNDETRNIIRKLR